MNPVSKPDYIFAKKKNRELAVITRLIGNPGGLLRPQFADQLHLALPYAWLGLRLPHKRLLRNFSHRQDKFNGDVDVCGGSLQPVSQEEYDRCFEFQRQEVRRSRDELLSSDANLPERFREQLRQESPALSIHNLASLMLLKGGKIKWPPDLSYISAMEVKASWYSKKNDLHATGSKSEGRNQALVLCKMGFDRVALSRFLLTEPKEYDGQHPWLVAGARAGDAAYELLNDETKGIIVKDDDPYGTVLIDVGAVPEKPEDMAGAHGWKWLQPVPENPHKAEAADARRAMEEALFEVMNRHPVPRSVPVLILACSDDKCGNIYVEEVNPAALCPNCGKPPRTYPVQETELSESSDD